MMKYTAILIGIFLVVSETSFGELPVSAVSSPPAEVYLGHGKAPMTPPVGTPLAGYGKRRGKPSTGVYDPLYARSLAVTHGGQTFVFVSVDLVLVDQYLRKRVMEKLKQTALSEDHLVLFATHTHSGAGAIGKRFWQRLIMGKFRKKIFEDVTGAIARAVIESLSRQERVSADWGRIDISGMVENRMDEKLNYPDQLKMLRFKNDGEEVLGAMIFMAAHPTLISAKDTLFSADFPGVLVRRLEESHPQAVFLFANGAAADLRPHTEGHFESRYERSEKYGEALFEQTQKISFEPVQLTGPWNAKLEKLKLPGVKIRQGFLRVPSLLGNRFFPRDTYLQAVRMGPLFLIAVPGELGAEIAYEMEARLGEKKLIPFTIGFANDYIGYIIPKRYYFNQDHYEARVSFYGKNLDRLFQERSDALAEALLSEAEKKEFNPPGRLEVRHGIPVLILKGDAYHVGFEEGRLLKKEVQAASRQIFSYLRKQLPIPLLNRALINRSLDGGWKKMEPYISYAEHRQIEGLARGSDVPLRIIERLHALPEMYPTWCSNGAYWGPATEGGGLIALRNLDWNREIGIHRFAAVKFYDRSARAFPSSPGETAAVTGPNSYVNIGYYGFTGVLSGMNEKGISVGQIGAVSEDETLKGVPMPFLLKRVLSEASSLDEATAIFERSDKTQGYNYVLADAGARQALAIESTRNHLSFFKDDDPREKNVPYAVSIPYAVFRADPALDPGIRELQRASGGDPGRPGLETPSGSAYEIRYLKHGRLIREHYGKINVEIAKTMAREIAPKSNIQSVIYAFPEFYVANAQDDVPAAQTEYAAFSFDDLREKSSSTAS